uniref:RNA helicase n=1 Tax=Spongospora subterranea TaxID=70186 RepID=A0A0H5R711_9EUKA|eukprot:CRZ09903.1 hypothetical protein [Spongospora subterranea]
MAKDPAEPDQRPKGHSGRGRRPGGGRGRMQNHVRPSTEIYDIRRVHTEKSPISSSNNISQNTWGDEPVSKADPSGVHSGRWQEPSVRDIKPPTAGWGSPTSTCETTSDSWSTPSLQKANNWGSPPVTPAQTQSSTNSWSTVLSQAETKTSTKSALGSASGRPPRDSWSARSSSGAISPNQSSSWSNPPSSSAVSTPSMVSNRGGGITTSRPKTGWETTSSNNNSAQSHTNNWDAPPSTTPQPPAKRESPSSVSARPSINPSENSGTWDTIESGGPAWAAPMRKPSRPSSCEEVDGSFSRTGSDDAAPLTGWDAPIVRHCAERDESPAPDGILSSHLEMLELFGDPDVPVSSGIDFDKYDNIPVAITGNNPVACIESFSDMKLSELLLGNIELARYVKPTPIQKYSIPIALNSRDMMSCAQTGSGKTAAFLVPAIEMILTNRIPFAPPDDVGTQRTAFPRVLVLSPTRELAIQIHFEARKFCFGTDCRCAVVYGGQDLRQQARSLNRGCDIIVATPGRLLDFIERGSINLCLTRLLVLDEADRMLDMGFEPQIRKVVEGSDLPSSECGRQTLMFSATFPDSIQKLASCFLVDYLYLTVGRVGSTSASIKQIVEYAAEHDKRNVLLRLMPQIKGQTIVFVGTKRTADLLSDWFRREKIGATCIHGDRTQEQRELALQQFREGKVPVIVATDVAARGLDVPHVAWVVNYDLPNSIEDYVHRIGRTGRCGNTGSALSLINERNGSVIRGIYALLQETEQEIPQFLKTMIERNRFDPEPRRGRPARPQRTDEPQFHNRHHNSFKIG